MQYMKTISHTLQEPEVVLNLWAYAGEDGYIVRLAGKAYVLEGNDKLKLSLLRSLASTDWLASGGCQGRCRQKVVNQAAFWMV
jgi:hypothetical protein